MNRLEKMLESEYEQGARDSTRQIIEWLRNEPPIKYVGTWRGLSGRMVRDVLREAANAIERGEHEPV